jgi:hypothetical protein
MKYRMKRHITKATLIIVLGMLITIITADLVIHALTPIRTTAFYYRLLANVCIVVIFAIIWFKIIWFKKDGEKHGI